MTFVKRWITWGWTPAISSSKSGIEATHLSLNGTVPTQGDLDRIDIVINDYGPFKNIRNYIKLVPYTAKEGVVVEVDTFRRAYKVSAAGTNECVVCAQAEECEALFQGTRGSPAETETLLYPQDQRQIHCVQSEGRAVAEALSRGVRSSRHVDVLRAPEREGAVITRRWSRCFSLRPTERSP